MADAPPPLPEQPLPDWMSYSLVVGPDGSEEYTIVSLPLTYYGPSIPLGDGWTYGGLTPPDETSTDAGEQPAPTDAQPTPTPPPGASTVTVTLVPDPSTVFVTVTQTVTVTYNPSAATPTSFIPIPNASSLPAFSSLPSSTSPTPSASSSSSASSFVPPIVPGGGSSISLPPGSTSTPSRTSSPPTNGNSSTLTSPSIPGTSSTPTITRTSNPAPLPESALPSVTGSARTYLGLAPNAFLGLILGIVFALLLLLCCLVLLIRRRRRKQREKRIDAYPPPAAEQGSRLLAGDRDPTREDLAFPYAAGDPSREYRRSELAVMHARGELDDDEWQNRVHSPSIRTASLRLPEEEVGTAYGIRERAFAAAGVKPPYGYAPVPRESASIGSGMRSIGTNNSTIVPTVTPTTAGMSGKYYDPGAAAATAAVGAALGATAASEARASPTPRKDTQSTQATNDSSAIHMYAGGGRSRMDSSDSNGNNGFFYDPTSHEGEPEGPSPVASSSDLHFLQRISRQTGLGAVAAAAGAVFGARQTHSAGSGSTDSTGSGNASRTRNLDDVPRSAMAYPESPVSSEDQEHSRLMPDGDAPVVALGDTPPSRSHSRSTKESGLSRWVGGGSNRSSHSQQPPILQRMLNRLTGNRGSTQPGVNVIPATPPRAPPSAYQYRDNPSRNSNGDFEVGNGLRFPRPPVHTGYSSGASTARDDMRVWGGILPSRWSTATPRENTDPGRSSGGNEAMMSQMEEGNGVTRRPLGMPIMSSRELLSQPQMRERPSTPGGMPLLGFGLRPPPPSAYPSATQGSNLDHHSSGVSSARSTVYFDARSNLTTPMQTLDSRAGSPYNRYDSPPPHPITALRSPHSDQSLQSSHTAPFLPPGLYPSAHDDDLDLLDEPPPMPIIRDVRQPRSLHTIMSEDTGDSRDALPKSGPPSAMDSSPAPRFARSVPSDIAPSEAADADLGAAFGSVGRSTMSSWGRHGRAPATRDVLEEEPPEAQTRWRVLSAYPSNSEGGSLRSGRSFQEMGQRSDWRLTLGQPVVLVNPNDARSSGISNSFGFGNILRHQEGVNQMGSHSSRGSSNLTNVSHSRDIHSLRASEVGTGGSNGSKDSKSSGASRRTVSEHGQIRPSGRLSTIEDDAMLSAFGPGPSRAGERSDTFGTSSRDRPLLDRSHSHQGLEPWPTTEPPSAPPNFSTTPGIRLIGSENTAGMAGDGPFSAPVLPSRGWPTQGVPMDVTPEDGRRPSQTPSFLHRASPLRSQVLLDPHHSPQPSHSHSLSVETFPPGTSDSHSHTHGTHGAETTMGTMTEATTEDHHDPLPDMPLSDVEHILPPVVQQPKLDEDEDIRRRMVERRSPSPETWSEMPRWQQL